MSDYGPQREEHRAGMFREDPRVPLPNGQVGGSHYESSIQPTDYIYANNLDFFEGNVVKYVTRWRNKNGVEDLRKAKHYLEMLIEQEVI